MRSPAAGILQLSGLDDSLETLARGRQFSEFGRGRDLLRPLLMTSHAGRLHLDQALFDHHLSILQRTVEYAWARVADDLR